MRLFHHTGPSEARAIIRTGRFRPVSTSPTNADSGLNCYDSRRGYWPNRHEGEGVIVVLEWVGSAARVVGQSFPPPYQAGFLLDMHPWRMFIPAPLRDTAQLRMSHLRFQSGEARREFFGGGDKKPTRFRILKMLSRDRKQRLANLKEIRSRYRANDCWISIY